MKESAMFMTAVALTGLACGRADVPQGRNEATAPPGTKPELPGEVDPIARWAALLPDAVRHRSGACPFESCVYRDWTPTGDVALRPAPRHAEPTGRVIPAGQNFDADSGFVRVTGVSLVAVTDSVMAEPQGGAPFLEGDTLVVLDYVGEGFYNVWDGERVRQISGF